MSRRRLAAIRCSPGMFAAKFHPGLDRSLLQGEIGERSDRTVQGVFQSEKQRSLGPVVPEGVRAFQGVRIVDALEQLVYTCRVGAERCSEVLAAGRESRPDRGSWPELLVVQFDGGIRKYIEVARAGHDLGPLWLRCV